MRRFLILILCCILLATTVSAAGSVTNLQSNATIASDGTCQISLSLQLNFDGSESDLRFPLPENAKDISLNGTAAKTSRYSGSRWVDLSPVVYGAGVYSLTIHYSLPDLVAQKGKTGLVLTLPLLSGFAYPIDNMEFSIALPGEPEQLPVFSSTYHPESMESCLSYSVSGSVITGHFLQHVKDHESLTMTLAVSDKLFPQTVVKKWSISYDDLLQYSLLLLALIYWLIFLRCPLPRRLRRVQAPDAITAGELGCCLSGQGVDFATMVLSWAQMGYLTIRMDRNHRVLLQKNMDMGNERSEFEMRAFRTLFGSRRVVDGSGEHYARLGRKAGKTIPCAGHYFKKHSGNPYIFRSIAALIGAVAGYSLAVAFATDTVWQIVLSIGLIPLGFITSWLIQNGARGIYLRFHFDLYLGLGCALLWLLLGRFSGEIAVGIFVIASQALSGVAATHGSRRTDAGLQIRNEILGLRKYLNTVPADELHRIEQHNPEYYFDMIPYALALGVDKSFSRQFGDQPLPVCPYLSVDGKSSLNAQQWDALLRQVVQVLDDRQRKLIWQKIFKK